MATTTERLVEQFPDLKFVKLTPAQDHPLFNYPGFKPGVQTIPKGHVRSPGRRSFTKDVIFERDVAVSMRDGVKIFTDIFRPAGSDQVKYPVLIPWSPYGKTGSGPQQYEMMGPYSCGVPNATVSGYQKFEAPDPAEWCCNRGYAIANVDCRGAGMSEGDTFWWGLQEAEDIYDTVDWLAKQPWSNGSVAMIGNSWLAIAQINYASSTLR